MKSVMIKMILNPAVLVFYKSMDRKNKKRLLMILFFWVAPVMKISLLAEKMINSSINQLNHEKIDGVFGVWTRDVIVDLVAAVIMPRVVPSHDEVYLCSVVDVSASDSVFWVRGFEPKASMRNVHHMAIAGDNFLLDISWNVTTLPENALKRGLGWPI